MEFKIAWGKLFAEKTPLITQRIIPGLLRKNIPVIRRYWVKKISLIAFPAPVKRVSGLIVLVEVICHMDPFEKALFLFTNKRKIRSKH